MCTFTAHSTLDRHTLACHAIHARNKRAQNRHTRVDDRGRHVGNDRSMEARQRHQTQRSLLD